MIVKDYIDANDHDTPVVISAKDTEDPYDPVHKDLWSGSLESIPDEYRNLEVISEGYLLGRKINQLTVLLKKATR